MYVCTCVCIRVHVCHVSIVCHECIDTCKYLISVHLDTILLVVSDGDDSTKGWKSLFKNPGVIEVQELLEVFVHSENHSLVHQIVRHSSVPWGNFFEFADLAGKIVTSKQRELTFASHGGHYQNGKGTGIKGTRRFP